MCQSFLVDLLKTKLLLNYILGKEPPFILRTTRNTLTHSLGRMQGSSVLKRVVHKLTTGL
jgi:hypothetical protein